MSGLPNVRGMSCSTNGRGFWSQRPARVRLLKLRLGYLSEDNDFGELRVHFGRRCWRPADHGLIYTDQGWLTELRALLVSCGMSVQAAHDVDYSEQGMQGDDYVSLDVGKPFLREAL